MFEAPHPRLASRLLGHEEAVTTFMQAAHSGKMHHAWILAGEEGLGKATFAYMAANYLLQGQKDFYAPPLSQIAAQSHPNLLVLERPLERTATGLYKTIPVELVRKIHPFFGATAGDGGKRICIIDAVEDLNLSGLNALLKMVEEPPREAIFLLISHRPYQLLPTLRSRARLLAFKAHEDDHLKAIISALGLRANQETLAQAKGNVRRALNFLDEDVQQLRGLLQEALQLKRMGKQSVKLGEMIAGKDARLFSLFRDEINAYLYEKALEMANFQDFVGAEKYDNLRLKINAEIEKTQGLNLDRKACVLMVMGWLFD